MRWNSEMATVSSTNSGGSNKMTVTVESKRKHSQSPDDCDISPNANQSYKHRTKYFRFSSKAFQLLWQNRNQAFLSRSSEEGAIDLRETGIPVLSSVSAEFHLSDQEPSSPVGAA